VFGAAGGVGLAAVQIGHLLGATVIAVASTPEKRALAARHGASITLDRDVEGWRDRLKAAVGGGIDVIFDPVCGPLFQPAFRSLNWGGRHLVVGFVGGPIPALPANLPLMKGASLVGVDYRQFAQVFEAGRADAELDELLGWVDVGRLDPPAGRVFSFAEYRDALTFALSGAGVAKTVLAVHRGAAPLGTETGRA
jgi:NADPH:quinone reductase